MNADQKIAAVNKYVEAFDQADINLIKELFADDATVEDPVGSDIHNGIEAICEFYRAAFESGAKLALNGTPRCAGNAVAFPFVVNASGMKIEVIDVFEFNNDGKINIMRAYWGSENLVA